MVAGGVHERVCRLALVVALVATALTAAAQTAPLPVVPRFLPAATRDALDKASASLKARTTAYDSVGAAFLARCTQVPATDATRVAWCNTNHAAMQDTAATIVADTRVFSSALAAEIAAIQTDPSVVDARDVRDAAQWTAQVPELANSPEVNRITKGFQMVMDHQWPAAYAWWKDAFTRDPNNGALKRSVELAQWMVERHSALTPGPVTTLGAAIHAASTGNDAEAVRLFDLARQEHPGIAAQADRMISAIELRRHEAVEVATRQWREEKLTRDIAEGFRIHGLKRAIAGDIEGARKAFENEELMLRSLRVPPTQSRKL